MSRRIVKARLHLLATNEGGRSEPLLSGYRSLVRFDGSVVDHGVELELDPEARSGELAPGMSGFARLSFWATEEMPPVPYGRQFELREGTRVVGRGSVVAGTESMYVSLSDIERAFEDLLSGARSREEIAAWAHSATESNDLDTLQYDPPGAERRIWNGILYLLGVDLKEAPDVYLHDDGNFREFLKGWRGSC